MGVTFDAKVTVDTKVAGQTTITNNNLTILSGTLLIASVHWGHAATITQPASVVFTWNSVTMTLVPGSYIDDVFKSAVALYYLVNPTLGNQSLVGSWTGAYDAYLAAASFTGASLVGDVTTFPNVVTATGSSTLASASPATVAGDANYAAFTCASSFSANTGTQIFADSSAPIPAGLAAYSVPGVSPMTATLTSNSWVAVVAEIAAAVSGDTLGGPMTLVQMKRKISGWTPPLIDHRRRILRPNRSLWAPQKLLLPKNFKKVA